MQKQHLLLDFEQFFVILPRLLHLHDTLRIAHKFALHNALMHEALYTKTLLFNTLCRVIHIIHRTPLKRELSGIKCVQLNATLRNISLRLFW